MKLIGDHSVQSIKNISMCFRLCVYIIDIYDEISRGTISQISL